MKPTIGRIVLYQRHAPALAGYPAVWANDWCGDHKLDEGKVGGGG